MPLCFSEASQRRTASRDLRQGGAAARFPEGVRPIVSAALRLRCSRGKERRQGALGDGLKQEPQYASREAARTPGAGSARQEIRARNAGVGRDAA